MWQSATPALRALVVDIFAPREPGWVDERLSSILASEEPALLVAGLRFVRARGDRKWAQAVLAALQSADTAVRREAIATGIALALPAARETCRRALAGPDAASCTVLGLLAQSPEPRDRALVRARAQSPEGRRSALWALGFTGDLESVELLVQTLDDPPSAKLAGEALAAITGIAITGSLAKPGASAPHEHDTTGGGEPEPSWATTAWCSEDLLAEPDAETVKRWWSKARSRFRADTRYVYGQPRNGATLQAAFATAPTWRRELLWIDLAAAGNPPRVNLRTWARDQDRRTG